MGAVATAGPAWAQTKTFDLPAQAAATGIAAFARQADVQLLISASDADGKRTNAVRGAYAVPQALTLLLVGTGLSAQATGAGTWTVVPARPQGAATPVATGEPSIVSEVTVTGTHIRGAGQTASSLMIVSRSDLDRSGHATVAAALAALPQNFAGQNTEAATALGADPRGANTSYGTGVNLRGLGSDATLVLVNGRRLGGSGARGDFADISTLPSLAVERVEVLLDGASALYGSDAVGGVVNVILRRNLDGGEARILTGIGTDGEPAELQAGAVVGHTWTGGGVLFAYEAYRREALRAADRRFTANADLRSLGGSDWRQTFSHPGNIMRADPATGATVPFWGIPEGQSGVGLRPADFQAGRINLENQRDGTDVLPDQRRQSAYLALRQSLGSHIELSGEARYGFRRIKILNSAPVTLLTVSRANNPFFVSPSGATSHQIQYSFSDELPRPVTRASAESLSLAGGAKVELFRDWQADGFMGFAQEINEGGSSGLVNSTLLSEALGNTVDRPTTAYSAARDGFFNPFTGNLSNTPATLAASGSGFTDNRSRSRVTTAALQADGTIFDLPAGPVKLALGGQARREAFRRTGANYTSTVAPVAQAPTSADRTVLALFVEARAPLFSEANRRPGFEALEVSAAVRWERYDDFGETLNPKAGLNWSPTRDLKVRGTYGRSFRAPGLREVRDGPVYSPGLFPVGAARVLGLILNGGNPDLDAETATSFTAGVDYQPSFVPGLRLSATWFDVAYKDRIDQPVRQNTSAALTDPTVASFVQRISPATNPQDLALISALLADPATSTAQGSFPPEMYGAIVDARYVNTGRLDVSGLDVTGTYAADLAGGRLGLGANLTYMAQYKQTLTPTSASLDRVGQIGFPAEFRGRVTAEWTRGAVMMGTALSRTSAFRDVAGVRIGSLTTVDLQARISAPEGGWSEGTMLTFSVRNLFDKAPPFYDNPAGFAFDASQGDLIGRFVSLQLTKRW